jgi:hypothetical protein
MSDKDIDYLGTSRGFQLRATVTGLMLKGAGYGAALVVAVALFVWVFYLIGLALPDASKEADDPTPLSFNQVIEPERQITLNV